MTETPQLPAPEEEKTSKSNGRSVQQIVAIAAAALGGIIILVVLIGIVLATATDAQHTSLVIQVIRDVFIIALVLQGILVIAALAILILQIARLINLLQNEVMPILKNTQDTVSTARGTVEFVGNNVVEPVVKLNGFLAAIAVLLRELFGIRRAIRRTPVLPEESAHDE